MKHGWKWAQWHEWKALRSESPPRWKGSKRRPEAGGGRSVSAAACEERESLRGDCVLLVNSDYSDGGGSDVGAVQENSQRRFVMATLWKMLLLELSFTSDCLSSAWSHIYTHTHRYTHVCVQSAAAVEGGVSGVAIFVRGSWVIDVYGGAWRCFISEAGLKTSQSPVKPDVESADLRLHDAVKAACILTSPWPCQQASSLPLLHGSVESVRVLCVELTNHTNCWCEFVSQCVCELKLQITSIRNRERQRAFVFLLVSSGFSLERSPVSFLTQTGGSVPSDQHGQSLRPQLLQRSTMHRHPLLVRCWDHHLQLHSDLNRFQNHCDNPARSAWCVCRPHTKGQLCLFCFCRKNQVCKVCLDMFYIVLKPMFQSSY